MRVSLERADEPGAPTRIANAITDEDGRVSSFADASDLTPGAYRLRFETGAYFEAGGVDAFHPHIEVVFRIAADSGHIHVPLLLSPFGYTTYRGS